MKLNDTFIRKWFISRTHTHTHSHNDSFCFNKRWWNVNAVQAKCKPLLILLVRHRPLSPELTGTSVEVASSFLRWPFLCRSGERKRNDIVWLSPSWETTSDKKQKDEEVAEEEEEEEGLFFWLLSPHSAAAALLHRTNTCCPSATPREKSIALCDNLDSCVQRGETPLDVVKILWHPSSPCFALPLTPFHRVYSLFVILFFCFAFLPLICSEVFLKRSPSPPQKSRPLFSSRAASSEEYKRPILSQFSVAFLCACAGVCLCMWASAKQQEKLTTQ